MLLGLVVVVAEARLLQQTFDKDMYAAADIAGTLENSVVDTVSTKHKMNPTLGFGHVGLAEAVGHAQTPITSLMQAEVYHAVPSMFDELQPGYHLESGHTRRAFNVQNLRV